MALVLAMSSTALAAGVCKIGDTKYTSLAEAVAEVPADGTPTTITLLADTAGSGVKVVSGQNIIFELGGHAYTVTDPLVGSSGLRDGKHHRQHQHLCCGWTGGL